MANGNIVLSEYNTTHHTVDKMLTFSMTHWKLVSLSNKDINASSLSREAHIIFSPLVEGNANFHGASGCNEMLGKYEGYEQNLTIDNKHIAMTRMACPDMKIETQFLQVLGHAIRWEMTNEKLELFDSNQTIIARFKAVKTNK
jgi:heat shock protein HslJ